MGFSPLSSLFFLGGVNKMRILAVDQARNGGWAIYDYEKQKLVDYGSFSFPNGKYTFSEAVCEIEKYISQLITKRKISVVFLEDINLRANVSVFKNLAQLQGVLINLCEKKHYLYQLISPSVWQNYCNARGRTSKEIKAKITATIPNDNKAKKRSKILSLQYVKNKYDIDTDNDNISDAICIGDYAVHNINIQHKE